MVLDLEKNVEARRSTISSEPLEKGATSHEVLPISQVPKMLHVLNEKIEGLAGLEARGISRVLPEERHDISAFRYAQMAILWWSANISANNLAAGLLGPLLFGLGFVDSVMMVVFGCMVGSAVVGYMSTWGAQSGNRTMVGHHLISSSKATVDQERDH